MPVTAEQVAIAVSCTLLGMLSALFVARRLFGTPAKPLSASPVALKRSSLRGKDRSVVDTSCKMVMVVNVGLKMDKGKIAAQCCHACLGAYKKAVKRNPEYVDAWMEYGQTKICVKVPNDEELMELTQRAEQLGLPHYLVVDAGRTQIPRGSRTVLGVGPAPDAMVDQVTKGLKLL